MALTVIVLGGLGIWMLLLGHAYDRAFVSSPCRHARGCDIYNGVLSLSDQADVINLLLLFAPCLLGMVFGAPLVAGELEHYTNRLAWTQGISRTKWIIVKWCVVGLSLVTVVALLTLIVQWWTGHAAERLSTSLMIELRLGGGPLQPLYFPITGLALSAYTLFAFALGTALGAVIRKTSWAIAGTVVIYTAVSVVAVLFIRPSLAPQVFVQSPQIATSTNTTIVHEIRGSWNLGTGYRYAPGTHESGPSAAEVAQRCQVQNYNEAPYLACLSHHHVQSGTFYLTANHYWELQWRESALLLLTSGALLGVTVWSVRRWTA
jgi:hypothetical protein